MRIFPTWCGEPLVTLESAPAVLAVTLAEAKEHLRVDHDDDNATITAMLGAAIGHLEGWQGVTRRAFIAQDWRVSVERADGLARLFAPLPALESVRIDYYPPDNETLTQADLADFRLIKGPDWSYLEPKPGKSWPSVDDRPDALQAVFTCGYGEAASDVPAPIRHAIKLLVGHLYENRENTTGLTLQKLPFGVEALITPYRLGFYG